MKTAGATAAIERSFDGDAVRRRSTARSALRLLGRRPRLAIGTFGVLALILFAILAPSFVSRGPYAQDLTVPLHAPSWSHAFGTDALGREELTRTIYGARTSLEVASVAVIISICVGTAIGLVSGWFGGIVDEVLMGVVEVFVSFPFILLAIVVVAFLRPSTGHTVIALAVTGWVALARIIRGQVLSLKTAPFIESARTVGCSTPRLLLRHILPQTVSSITVIGTLEISRMMLVEGGLSFLGLGVPLPTPSWGNMLADGKSHLSDAWWLTTFPGAALLVAGLLVNQLGDGLRDIFDPTLRGR